MVTTNECPHCGWDLQDQDDEGGSLIKCPQCGQEVSLAAQTIPGYYTLTQAAEICDLTQRGAEKAAIREGWQFVRAGNANFYRAEDIHRYRDHRRRTKLVKGLGWRGRGLYRDKVVDYECPVPECGKYAVQYPLLTGNFLCMDGHSGHCYDYHYDTDTGDDRGTIGQNRNPAEDQEIPW